MDSQQTTPVDSHQTTPVDSHQTTPVDSHQTVQMNGHMTLQDFVLSLLSDPDAKAAFDHDPEGALQAVGLSDITAADVQDMVPLVVDYASVAPVTGQLGIDSPVADATDVVGQLQTAPQETSISGTYSGVDVKAGVLGAIAVDPTAVAVGATVLPGIGLGVGPDGLGADLTGAHDVAHTLDVDMVGAVDIVADPMVGDVAGTVGSPDSILHATDHGLLGTTDGLLRGVLSGGQGQVGGIGGSLGVDDTLGGLGLGDGGGGVVVPADAPSIVGGVTHQVDGVLPGATGTVGGLTGDVTGGVTADAGVHSEVSASTGLGFTDGLL
ncbi:IniB N-terminal domain-containing protein [Micromonospora sp. NPDC050200]|uniref:IniB N-terminal domain-containing protein n=1 Tax=Micromonospora sp. NPDC050200 TaxID=3155664 RepID=UPI0033DF0277